MPRDARPWQKPLVQSLRCGGHAAVRDYPLSIWGASSGQSGFHQRVAVLGLQFRNQSMIRLARALMSSNPCPANCASQESSSVTPMKRYLCYRATVKWRGPAVTGSASAPLPSNAGQTLSRSGQAQTPRVLAVTDSLFGRMASRLPRRYPAPSGVEGLRRYSAVFTRTSPCEAPTWENEGR